MENSSRDRNTRSPYLSLRHLYAGQEVTFRTKHGTTDWFKIGKGVLQGYISSPCLFNFYAEYIMQNEGVDESQSGTKVTRRNTNNLRHADDTSQMTENEENYRKTSTSPLLLTPKPLTVYITTNCGNFLK